MTGNTPLTTAPSQLIWLQWSLGPNAHLTVTFYQFYQQRNLSNPFPPFYFHSPSLVSPIIVSLSQFNLHIPKELNPNPFSLALKAHAVWAPTYLSNPIFFHYSLKSATVAKLNHSFLYTPDAFPLPSLVRFIPSWNALLFFTLKNSNPSHHLSSPSSNAIMPSLTLPNWKWSLSPLNTYMLFTPLL